MKKTLIATAATLTAFALTTAGAHAQGKNGDKKMMDKPMMNMDGKMSQGEMYKANWVFRNLDSVDVRRYQAQGFKDQDIKGAANIAMRAGVSTDYILDRFRVSGQPLGVVAAMFGLSTKVVDEDIPMMGWSNSAMAAPVMKK